MQRDRPGGSGAASARLGGPPMDDDDAFSYRFTTLDEVQGQVLSIAKDQNGCRCAPDTPATNLFSFSCCLQAF